MKNIKTNLLRYHYDGEPTEGTPIVAEFSDAQCLTQCKHREFTKVGSLSCSTCDYYAGCSEHGEVINAKGSFGCVTHTQKIYCKKG